MRIRTASGFSSATTGRCAQQIPAEESERRTGPRGPAKRPLERSQGSAPPQVIRAGRRCRARTVAPSTSSCPLVGAQMPSSAQRVVVFPVPLLRRTRRSRHGELRTTGRRQPSSYQSPSPRTVRLHRCPSTRNPSAAGRARARFRSEPVGQNNRTSRAPRCRSVPLLETEVAHLEQAGRHERPPGFLSRTDDQLQRATLREMLGADGPGAFEVRSSDLEVPRMREELEITPLD
jgi:hypothetical protein